MNAHPHSTPKHASHTSVPVSPLGEKLEALIGGLPPDGVTLATILDHVGQEGLLLLTLFLTLIFLVPISIPGVSTVFGFAILMIGLSRLFNRPLWIPRRLAHRVLPRINCAWRSLRAANGFVASNASAARIASTDWSLLPRRVF